VARYQRAHSSSLALIAAAASWGTATAISKRAVDEVPPLTLLPIELAISVAVLGVAMRFSRRPLALSPELRQLGYLGVLNPGVSYALSLAGLARITASTSVLLWAAEPVLILVLAYLMLRDRASPALVGCAGAALIGVTLVVAQPGRHGSALGVALTLAGVAACAAYTVLSTQLLHEESSMSVVLVQQVAALGFSLVLFAGSLVVGEPPNLSDVSAAAWASALAAGLLYYALAFWFYVSGLRGVRPGYAGMFINLVPVFGLAASYALLHERLSPRQAAGAAMILVAVMIIARLQARAHRRGPVPLAEHARQREE